jgi:hypothetical protein
MLDQKYSTNSIITVLEPGKFNIEITEISETGTGRMVCSMEEIDLKTIRSLLKTLEEITSFNTEVEKVRGKCPY